MTMHFSLMLCLLFYQVKQEAVKMESSSSTSHMSPAVCKTSSAGMLIKSEGKISENGTWRPVILKFNFCLSKCLLEGVTLAWVTVVDKGEQSQCHPLFV